MRVSSLALYTQTQYGVREHQSNIARLSQQITSEKRLLGAKDAPVDAAIALGLADSISTRTQFQANQTRADFSLKEEEVILGELESALDNARNVVMGSNASPSDSTRTNLAIELTYMYKHIKELANSRDSSGNFLFAGSQVNTQPYAHDSVYDGAVGPQDTVYAGDAVTRQAEIGTDRYVQTNDDLESIFQSGTTNDLLKNIDEIATGLRDGTLTDADLDNSYAILNGAMNSLQLVQAKVAGRRIEIADSQSTNQSLILNEQANLGKLEEIDVSAAIISLQQRQTALQAAESAFGMTSRQSLFNYLG